MVVVVLYLYQPRVRLAVSAMIAALTIVICLLRDTVAGVRQIKAPSCVLVLGGVVLYTSAPTSR